MTPERWREIQAVFAAALDQAADEREPFVREACQHDRSLAAEVLALLAADGATCLLDRGAGEALGDIEPSPAAGQRVGAFELVRRIGEGGMGEVFLARRVDGGFDQQVAIKLMRSALADERARARFARERQLVARLEHPNIARLYDGGTTDDGRPYFVMEYVDGSPIDVHCRDQELRLEQRLELFAEVCDAVQAAHDAGVFHRDIKPDNVLVSRSGRVKLLDFGIARAVDPDNPAVSATDPRHRVMTPQYAAPEQVSGLPVSGAADVYSLGVVLYQLVAGRLPYSTRDLPPSKIAAAVCGAAIARPGTGFAIDDVCLRALARSPEERFPGPKELAAAVRAQLQPSPTEARRLHWFILAVIAVAAAAFGYLLGRSG